MPPSPCLLPHPTRWAAGSGGDREGNVMAARLQVGGPHPCPHSLSPPTTCPHHPKSGSPPLPAEHGCGGTHPLPLPAPLPISAVPLHYGKVLSRPGLHQPPSSPLTTHYFPTPPKIRICPSASRSWGYRHPTPWPPLPPTHLSWPTMPGVGPLQLMAASLTVYVLKRGPDPPSAMHTFASPCPSPPLPLTGA